MGASFRHRQELRDNQVYLYISAPIAECHTSDVLAAENGIICHIYGTTRDLMLGNVIFMSQKCLFLLCFAFCDIRVTKLRSSPNLGHKMYTVTKIYFFVTNFVMIITVSLICDTCFSSLSSLENVAKSMPWLIVQVPVGQKTSQNFNLF